MRPNSPNVLPMSECCWGVRFFVSVNFSVFHGDWGEQWDYGGDHMNILWGEALDRFGI